MAPAVPSIKHASRKIQLSPKTRNASNQTKGSKLAAAITKSHRTHAGHESMNLKLSTSPHIIKRRKLLRGQIKQPGLSMPGPKLQAGYFINRSLYDVHRISCTRA